MACPDRDHVAEETTCLQGPGVPSATPTLEVTTMDNIFINNAQRVLLEHGKAAIDEVKAYIAVALLPPGRWGYRCVEQASGLSEEVTRRVLPRYKDEVSVYGLITCAREGEQNSTVAGIWRPLGGYIPLKQGGLESGQGDPEDLYPSNLSYSSLTSLI